MSDGNDLELFGLESLDNLVVTTNQLSFLTMTNHMSDSRWNPSNFSLDLSNVGTVCLQTIESARISISPTLCVPADVPVGKRIPKVTSVEHQSIIPPFDQVGTHSIPSHGSTSSNEEWLITLFFGIQDFSEHSQTVSKDRDECWRNVGCSGGSVRSEDWVGELDRPWDTGSRVSIVAHQYQHRDGDGTHTRSLWGACLKSDMVDAVL